jgi:hypothetical protein
MNVAKSGQSADAIGTPEPDPGFRGYLADARERQVRELFLPRIKQRHRVVAGEGEEQFEILAIGQGGEQGGLDGGFRPGLKFGGTADGDGRVEQVGAGTAGVKQMAQIAGEAVAHVD